MKSPARTPTLQVPVGLMAPSGDSVRTPLGEVDCPSVDAVMARTAMMLNADLQIIPLILTPPQTGCGEARIDGDELLPMREDKGRRLNKVPAAGHLASADTPRLGRPQRGAETLAAQVTPTAWRRGPFPRSLQFCLP